MKKYLLLAIFLLSGCVTSQVSEDMISSQFVTIAPTEPPKALSGNWSGNFGPSLSGLKIGTDGRGVTCSNFSGLSVSRIKYDNGVIYYDSGIRSLVESVSPEILVLKSPYNSGKEYLFYRDEGFLEAPAECAEALK